MADVTLRQKRRGTGAERERNEGVPRAFSLAKSNQDWQLTRLVPDLEEARKLRVRFAVALRAKAFAGDVSPGKNERAYPLQGEPNRRLRTGVDGIVGNSQNLSGSQCFRMLPHGRMECKRSRLKSLVFQALNPRNPARNGDGQAL